jgi:gluconokinase
LRERTCKYLDGRLTQPPRPLPPRSGKSTVGTGLAQKFGIPYVDGDTLHSKENIDKMASGTPLVDADRVPWVRPRPRAGMRRPCSAARSRTHDEPTLTQTPLSLWFTLQLQKLFSHAVEQIAVHPSGCVVAASCLKKTYRDIQRGQGERQPDLLACTATSSLRR